jgi:hypothetical protein
MNAKINENINEFHFLYSANCCTLQYPNVYFSKRNFSATNFFALLQNRDTFVIGQSDGHICFMNFIYLCVEMLAT